MNNHNRVWFISLFLACIVFIASACDSNSAKGLSGVSSGSGISSADTLSYEMQRIEKHDGNMKAAANDNEVYCKCSYPVFSGGKPARLVNGTLRKRRLKPAKSKE